MRSPYRFIASNLHVGGGVQVAASLIDEAAALSEESEWRDYIAATSFEISSAVARNAMPSSVTKLGCAVTDRRPGKLGPLLRDWRWPCLSSLVVFGPIYSMPRSSRRVMGYADVTSVYPPVNGRPTWRSTIRGWLSRVEASRQHVLVAETAAMAAQTERALSRVPAIEVISNAVNMRALGSIDDARLRRQIEGVKRQAELVLAYPTRPYPHKNLDFLPRLAEALAPLGYRSQFLLTLTETEWEALTPGVRAVSVNLGELGVDQVSTLLRGADGVLFPSLLEAFSATPIEALAMESNLYASDRDFVRSVCGDAAVYFDPLDPFSAARVIACALEDPIEASRRKRLGLRIAGELPRAADRARDIFTILYGITLPDSDE